MGGDAARAAAACSSDTVAAGRSKPRILRHRSSSCPCFSSANIYELRLYNELIPLGAMGCAAVLVGLPDAELRSEVERLPHAMGRNTRTERRTDSRRPRSDSTPRSSLPSRRSMSRRASSHLTSSSRSGAGPALWLLATATGGDCSPRPPLSGWWHWRGDCPPPRRRASTRRSVRAGVGSDMRHRLLHPAQLVHQSGRRALPDEVHGRCPDQGFPRRHTTKCGSCTSTRSSGCTRTPTFRLECRLSLTRCCRRGRGGLRVPAADVVPATPAAAMAAGLPGVRLGRIHAAVFRRHGELHAHDDPRHGLLPCLGLGDRRPDVSRLSMLLLALALTFHLEAGFLLPSLAYLFCVAFRRGQVSQLVVALAGFVLVVAGTLLFFHLQGLPIRRPGRPQPGLRGRRPVSGRCSRHHLSSTIFRLPISRFCWCRPG